MNILGWQVYVLKVQYKGGNLFVYGEGEQAPTEQSLNVNTDGFGDNNLLVRYKTSSDAYAKAFGVHSIRI